MPIDLHEQFRVVVSGGKDPVPFADALRRAFESAERLFGTSTQTRPLEELRFEGEFPWTGDENGRRVLKVAHWCADNAWHLDHQLGHETVHLLQSIPGDAATVLEEGLATLHSELFCRQRHGGAEPPGAPAIYAFCRNAVESMLTLNPDAVKQMRFDEPVIARISPALIAKHNPQLPRPIVNFLPSLL